jgi:hypothetical protein
MSMCPEQVGGIVMRAEVGRTGEGYPPRLASGHQWDLRVHKKPPLTLMVMMTSAFAERIG